MTTTLVIHWLYRPVARTDPAPPDRCWSCRTLLDTPARPFTANERRLIALGYRPLCESCWTDIWNRER
jgi:hypothetical protein